MADLSLESQVTDVVIVGSGPTGLMAGLLLTRCGIKIRIVDKSERQAHESRAFGVHARSMELLLSLGLADQFLDRGLIASGLQVYVDGQPVGGFDFDDLGRADSPYCFVLMVPQWDIEAILADELRRLGVEVEHSVEVVGLDLGPDRVVVHAKGRDGSSLDLPCSYVIGADGAHSIVRKATGLRFEGAAYTQGFLLADCKVDWPLDHDHLKLFLRGRDFAAFLPLKGQDISRIMAIQPVETDKNAPIESQGSSALSLEEVEQALRGATGLEVRLSEAVWTSRYRLHHRGVNHYRVGRAFVAGDAAHIHSPVGGQGMNTGLQDVANLAWKLALALKRGAPDGLLDTYDAERRPIGQKVLDYTDRIFARVASQAGWVTTLRNMLIPIFAATLKRSGTIRARAFHFVSQLGIHYHEGDFVREASSPGASKAWREGLSAGHRAPNALYARNQDVFGLIRGYQFHVLALSRMPLSRQAIQTLVGELAELPEDLGLPLKTHIIAHSLVGRDPAIHQAESNQIFEAYGLNHEIPQALFLIRPDGYIAYRSDRLDLAGLGQFLRRFGQDDH